ncbi:MAG TPA: hypothetical protein VJI33_04685 [Candidatus Paceibacterota bacterium]
MKNFFKIFSLSLVILPSVTFADGVTDIIKLAGYWLSLLVYIVIGIAMVLFFWGVIKYVIAGSGNEEGKQQARNLIIYGIAGIFVMVAIWGIVYFLASLFGVGIGGTPVVPNLPASGLAPTSGGGSLLIGLIVKIGGWIARIVTLLIGLALVLFLWGVARYVASDADEEKRTEARRFIAYGIMGMFVMIAIWGLVYFISSALGVGIGGNIDITKVQVTNINIGNIGPGNQPVSVTGTALTSCPVWNPGSTNPQNTSFIAFVCLILKILKPIPPILISLALLYFFWGVAKYMNAGGDAEKLQNGRITIIYGIIGMFVLIALWGLVYFVQSNLVLA